MAHPAGESNGGALRLDFDRRLMLQFCGSVVTSDAGLLPYRELDDVPGLTVIAGNSLADARTGKNGRHAPVGLLRESVVSRVAGYEDVNDAGSLRHDPAMRWIVGGKAAQMRRYHAMTTLKERLIKIGAKGVSPGRYVAVQRAEVAISRHLFRDVLRLIAELRPPPDPAPA